MIHIKRMVKLILVKQKKRTYYKFVASSHRVLRSWCRSQKIYLTEDYLHQCFLSLRAALDWEKHPVLIADFPSGCILSINLPAFELLKIDAVGSKIVDFAADVEIFERIYQQLQQTGKSHQTVLLHDADGKQMECKIDAEISLYCSRWTIFHLCINQ